MNIVTTHFSVPCSTNSRPSYSGWLLIPRRTVHALSNLGKPSSFWQKLDWQRTSIWLLREGKGESIFEMKGWEQDFFKKIVWTQKLLIRLRVTSCGQPNSFDTTWSVPNPLGLKCDTITSPRRLVNTFIHQMIPDLLKRDKPIKVANNFKSWSTTRDISSEWGWSSPIYAAKQISGPTATGKVGNSRNSYPISFFWKTTNKQGWVQTYSAAHLHPRNGEIRYNAWNMWSSRYFAETAIFYAELFWKTFCIFAKRILSKRSRKFFNIRTKSPGLNHPGISAVSHWFSFSKTATGLLVHHSSRLNRRTF